MHVDPDVADVGLGGCLLQTRLYLRQALTRIDYKLFKLCDSSFHKAIIRRLAAFVNRLLYSIY